MVGFSTGVQVYLYSGVFTVTQTIQCSPDLFDHEKGRGPPHAPLRGGGGDG